MTTYQPRLDHAGLEALEEMQARIMTYPNEVITVAWALQMAALIRRAAERMTETERPQDTSHHDE
jgi:hypothetical protein